MLTVILHLAGEEVSLGTTITKVAREEQHVARLHSPGEPHEQARVREHRHAHPLANNIGRLVGVEDACEHDSPVGSGPPEMHSFRTNGRIYERHK